MPKKLPQPKVHTEEEVGNAKPCDSCGRSFVEEVEYVGSEQAAAQFGVTRTTFLRQYEARSLPVLRLGKDNKFPQSILDKLKEEATTTL